MALLRFKRSAVPAKVPTLADLSLGELAINTFDGKIYIRRDNGTASIVEVGGGSGVLSFNTRTGAVTLTSGDVTGALGYTPANRAGDTFTGLVNSANGFASGFFGNFITDRFTVGGEPVLHYGLTITSSGKTYVSGYYGVSLATVGSERLTINTSGNVTANVDIRAPIFYDSNNTAYYVDPASASLLGAAFFNNVSLDPSSIGAGVAVGTITEGSTGFSAPGIAFGTGTGQHGAIVYSGGIMYFGAENGSDNTLGVKATLNNAGVFTAEGDVRAPIFYDSNNTAFYLDPASTSFINALTTAGALNAGNGTITAAGTTFSNVIAARGSSRVVLFDGNGNANPSVWWSNGGTAIGAIDAVSGGGLSFWANNTSSWQRQMVVNYGNVTVDTDIRAPIFYDSNNTAFYVDPAGNSILSTLRASNIQFPSGTVAINLDNSSYQILRDPTGNIALYLGGADPANYYDNTTHWFRNRAGSNVAYINASGIYAPVFYDFSNSGFYVDPASGSRLGGQVTFNGGTNIASNGDVYARRDSGATGVYYFATGGQKYLFWDGSRYYFGSDGPVDTDVSFRAPIYYDLNNTGYYIDPASTSVMFNFLNINQRVAYNRAWDNFPSITVVNTTDQGPQGDFRIHGAPGSSGGDFNVRLLVDGNIHTLSDLVANGGCYTTIYYDSNDTFFYLNPNGYSQINGFGSVNGSSGVGMSIMGNPSNGAIMSFHRSAAYAVNMGLDTDNVFRIGGWSAGANRLQMDMNGNLTMAGNVTAYSDARLKKDVETIDGALALVSKMRGVRYTRIDTENRNVGVIAQEMLEVLPEVVQQGVGDDDTLSVAYGNLVGVLIEAIKELRAEVEELKATTPTITFEG